jgi:hypothetical protein
VDYDPNTLDPELRTAKLYALASAAIGVISLCAAIIPLCGGTASFLGIGFGLLSLRTENSGVAKAGVGISILGLLITIVYAIFLLVSGQQ